MKAKKIILSAMALALCTMALFAGCSKTPANLTVTAIVDEVYTNAMLVTVTTEGSDFDKAHVSYNKDFKPDFVIEAGQTVELELLPEVQESYPVKVKAVAVKLIAPPKE